jgi:hypothetical protein
MTETKKTSKDQSVKFFRSAVGKRNPQPVKRSPLWDDDSPGPLAHSTGYQSRPQATADRSAREAVIYGTPAIRPIRFGIIAVCLVISTLTWKPPEAALWLIIPVSLALLWDNKRWIFREREMDIEYSNALRTKVITVRKANFLKVDKWVVKGSGSESYDVTITLSPGGIHKKTYPTDHEAELLKDRIRWMFGHG